MRFLSYAVLVLSNSIGRLAVTVHVRVPVSKIAPGSVASQARWAWSICLATLTLMTLAFGLSFDQDGPITLSPDDPREVAAVALVLVLPYTIIGTLIARRQPQNAIGWVLMAVGALSAFAAFTGVWGNVSHPGNLMLAAVLAGMSEIIWLPPLLILVTFVPLLFPTGTPPSPRWRWVGWLAGVGIGAMYLLSIVGSWSQREQIATGPDGIDGINGPDDERLFLVIGGVLVLVMIAVFGAITSMVVRFRRSDGQERVQLKLFVVASTVVAVMLAIQISTELPWLLQSAIWLISLLLPLSIGIAILRHGLYDIDVVISRTLLWFLLSGFVIGTYVLIVGFIGSRLASSNDLVLSLIATGIVAVCFQPVRVRLQAVINRRIFGDRDDPYAAVARLGRQLERVANPQAMLEAIVESVAQGLRLPYAAITLRDGDRFALAAAYGTATPSSSTLTLPLVASAEQVGELILAPRTPNERFGPADLRLLEDLARQIGVAAHAAQLTTDLQRSREQLVIAREEERRRIRNDLHDGLGPVLSGLKLRAETARNLVGDNPQVDALLADIAERTETAVADVRRLVYSLRPPALDDLGLGTALEELGYQAELPVTVTLPNPMPPLSAAVEVAVFRITQEALTNIARHADATTAHIELRADAHQLVMSINDDGRGLPTEARSGVGLRSMRERVSELGGTLIVDSSDGAGTTIHITFQLSPPIASEQEHVH